MRVLSLFDGISCARAALTQAGVHVDAYYASEVDPRAIQIALKNYPDTVQLGDIRTIAEPPTSIDLLIGGSPCQDLSIAKKNRQGLRGDRSSLFWEYIRILRQTRPRWFILENVASMMKADRDIITQELKVDPVLFNASLVSAQCRKRLFWTNIRFSPPPDQGILLKNILQPDAEVDESMIIKDMKFHSTSAKAERGKERGEFIQIGYVGKTNACGVGGQALRIYDVEGKSTTSGVGLYRVGESRIRKLTPIECERLQGLPDNYTEGIAKTHRYKCLGNGFCVPVITHILLALPAAETRCACDDT